MGTEAASTAGSAAPLLAVQALVAGYVRGLPIVHGASLTVAAGEVVTIIGPNGAGKSTLLKAVVGLVPVESGRVMLGAREITGLPAHEVIAAGVGYVPQTANVFTTLTIHDNLRAGAHLLADPRLLAARLDRAYEVFPALAAKRRDKARTLSGGQRQMLAVARALMTDPLLVVLDEPTAGLSPLLVEEVFMRVRALAATGVAVLMVEQNAKGALKHSHRGYVLAEGRNRIEGAAGELLSDPQVALAFLGGRTAVAGAAGLAAAAKEPA
ncbi:MAG: ABC transporter ATP-binding protein [Rubrivivax sp.]|nr:ABC transporter ATP-binding protein [Rubrivivax sp.]